MNSRLVVKILTCFFIVIFVLWLGVMKDDPADETTIIQTQNEAIASIKPLAEYKILLAKANALNDSHKAVFGEPGFLGNFNVVSITTNQQAFGANSILRAIVYKLEVKLGMERSVPRPPRSPLNHSNHNIAQTPTPFARYNHLIKRAKELNMLHQELYGETAFEGDFSRIIVTTPQQAIASAHVLEYAIYKVEEKIGLKHTVPKPIISFEPAPSSKPRDYEVESVKAIKPTAQIGLLANTILRHKIDDLEAKLVQAQANGQQVEALQAKLTIAKARVIELESVLSQILEGLNKNQQTLQN